MEHPFVRATGDFQSMRADGCYFLYPGAIRVTDLEIAAKTDNEIYVSSALSVLLDGKKDNGESDLRESGGGVVTWYRPDRAVRLIDAFVQSASLNLKTLAENLNRLGGDDLGTRWYREYFFFDLVSGRNLREALYLKPTPDGFFSKNELCLRDPKLASGYLTPILQAEENQVRAEALIAYGNRIDADEIRKDIDLYLEFFARQPREEQERFTTIAKADAGFRFRSETRRNLWEVRR